MHYFASGRSLFPIAMVELCTNSTVHLQQLPDRGKTMRHMLEAICCLSGPQVMHRLSESFACAGLLILKEKLSVTKLFTYNSCWGNSNMGLTIVSRCFLSFHLFVSSEI